MWNLEYWALESGILLKETRIQLRIAIQNPSSTDKYWNEVLVIRNPRRGIQNLWMSLIPLQAAKRWKTILTDNSSFSVLFFFSFETHQQRLWHCLSYSRQDNLHCAVAGFRNWLVWLCSLQNEISIAMKNNSQLQFFVLSQTHLQRLWHGLFCSKTIKLHCAGSGLELSSLTLQSPERNLNNDGIKKRAPYNTFSLALCRLPAVVNLFLFFYFLFYFTLFQTPPPGRVCTSTVPPSFQDNLRCVASRFIGSTGLLRCLQMKVWK